ncbi:MAG: (E)-4-hydroxy-3-methylbut-2-enyl-diphosphate synthase [Candidatus Poribacteria bacterium]|nr:(E)-4-hydroxy-3-methylbut-2-enyl-diphosphate synthase [Candidatus Poribacteria bacterium]
MELFAARRMTRTVHVGDVRIGSSADVVVQSMITADTRNVDACVEEIRRLVEVGCELARVTVPNMASAEAVVEIKERTRRERINVPLVADIHHQGSAIAVETAKVVDKVRINPGLFVYRKPMLRTIEYSPAEVQAELDEIEKQLLPVISACKEHDTAMRVGVNHGSLSERLLVMYGDSPEGMVNSALEYLRICEAHDFRNIVVSLKASRVPIMLAANRLFARMADKEGLRYPLHLGVTEAGDGQYARVKSSIGIGTLLAEGIGDTIRVSLAEDPVNEIPVCYEILQSLGLRKTTVEYIACPSCGRTQFDLPTVLNEVRNATRHLVGLDIAVMGCIVNGPGEMADADYGYVGKGGTIALYRGREVVKQGIPQENGVQELVGLLKADGMWREPNERADNAGAIG